MFHNAFLNYDLLEKVYIEIPKGFTRQKESHKVYELEKFSYGLKQAPTQWNLKLTEAPVQMGLKKSTVTIHCSLN